LEAPERTELGFRGGEEGAEPGAELDGEVVVFVLEANHDRYPPRLVLMVAEAVSEAFDPFVSFSALGAGMTCTED
jgi:hypothetical protein